MVLVEFCVFHNNYICMARHTQKCPFRRAGLSRGTTTTILRGGHRGAHLSTDKGEWAAEATSALQSDDHAIHIGR